MKKAILIILAVATVAAGILWVVKVRKPSVREARADFCTQLNNYGEAVANLRSIDQDSTVDELKTTQQAVQESWGALQKSAALLKTAELDALETSYAELENTVQNIPSDATLPEARMEIYQAALNVLANTLAADQVTCKISIFNSPSSAELLP